MPLTMKEGRDGVFCGTVVHSTDTCPMSVWENACLGVKHGQVVFLDNENRVAELMRKHELDTACVVQLKPSQFLMPGLVDCHIHSPQLPVQALGTDRGLLSWLETYIFPTEARFADSDFAQESHYKTVSRTLRSGTTAAAYYSTIHADTTLLLCKAANELGQRALVGKVNMDCSSPDYYRETTEESLLETERFVEEVLSMKSGLVTPVITPRFALNCTQTLLNQLGHLAAEKDLHIQTHINETRQEIEAVMAAHPGHETYADIYDAAGLLGPKTILGHCIHATDREINLLKQRDCGVVHCACSNTTLRSGLMDIRRQMEKGLKIGLGTDAAAGYTPSILQSLRHTVDVSNIRTIWTNENLQQHNVQLNRSGHDQARQVESKEGCEEAIEKGQNGLQDREPYLPLTMPEAFRLATLGGSKVLGLNCGNFEPGRDFDALLIDAQVRDSPLDLFDTDTAENTVIKFLYTGDDRNIIKVYVQGKQVVARED